ncbi:MAG: hypothetical protein V7679_13550 [Parasphingorhabdus sp.]
MAGANLEYMMEQMQKSMDSAASEFNSTDQTIYNCAQAQITALTGILVELQSIRKILERDA